MKRKIFNKFLVLIALFSVVGSVSVNSVTTFAQSQPSIESNSIIQEQESDASLDSNIITDSSNKPELQLKDLIKLDDNLNTGESQNANDSPNRVYSTDKFAYVELNGNESQEIIDEISNKLNENILTIMSMRGSQSGAHIGYQTSDGILREILTVQTQDEIANLISNRSGITLNKVRQINVEWHFIMPNSQMQFWGSYTDVLEDLNGNTLFCVEPTVLVNGHEGYTQTVLPSQVTIRMQQGASIGYSKVKDDAHFWNTHTFIYNELGVQWIKNSMYDQNIQNEINQGIANLAKRPSFNNKEVVLKIGESVTLEDTNDVFKDYEKLLSNTSGVQVSKNGNKITLTATADSNESGEIRFQRYNVEPVNIAYVKSGSQTLAALGDPDKARISIPVKVIKTGSVDLTKHDSETGENAQGAAVLDGAVYEIIDSTGVRHEAKVINKVAHFDNVYIGKIKVREIVAPKGYNLDPNVYEFNLQPNGNTINLKRTVTDKVIKGRIEGFKVGNKLLGGLLPIDNQKIPLEGVELSITSDTTGKVVQTMITDADGAFNSDDLPYDTYTVSETKSIWGYDVIKPFKVVIDKDGQVHKYVLEDIAYESLIKIMKKDFDTKELIPQAGIAFKILNVDTGEYVKQHINYPSAQEIDTFETAEDGTLMLPQALTAGNYQAEEVKAPTGYLLSEEPIPFTVDENSTEIIEVEVFNKRIPPVIHTTATDKETGSKVVSPEKQVTIIDKVDYEWLVSGHVYTVKGILMDKSTGQPLLVNGKEVRAEKTFTAEESHGQIDLEFTFDGSALAGQQVVVFETVYENDKEVATHTDINDVGQTVDFDIPAIQTTAMGKDGSKEIDANKDVTIIDTVKYSNLIKGKEYTIKGVLMDKSTGQPLLVNGKEVTAETTFVADKANGTVDVTFTFDGTGLQGKEVVVFEDLFRKGDLVISHADINDVGQTVKLVEPKVLPMTGERAFNMIRPALVFLVAGVVLTLRRKKEQESK